MKRRIPISENSVSAGYAWGPDGALWFGDLSDGSLRVATFESGEDLHLSKIDVAMTGGSDFWVERGFAIGPDGRRLMIRAAGAAPGQDGRLHVVVGWAQEHGLSSSSFLR
jgi:hypothetical protein